jgi:hypothetical protein
MNPHPQNFPAPKTASGHKTVPGAAEAETTLRLIAALPAPEGLEERVKTALHQSVHQTPQSRSLLHWPRTDWMQTQMQSWARTAAAAAIVFVVIGGGWEIYARVQPAPQPNAIALPPQPTSGHAHGGFASANAIRKPRTLDGTALTHPLAAPANPDAAGGKKPADQTKTNQIGKPAKSSSGQSTRPRSQ